MKILIGTPIHQVKDYCMERWLENVARLLRRTPSELLLVDNSPGLEYVEKVKGYLKKYKIKNYRIEHLEIDQHLGIDLIIEVSQETIRQYILSHNFDAWFSWECDQIIPNGALDKLIELMNQGDYMMVVANSWARWDSTILNTNMGVTLIHREGLKKGWFLPKKRGKISLRLADSYNVNETMLKKRILNAGGNYIEVFGIIKPIYHLNN